MPLRIAPQHADGPARVREFIRQVTTANPHPALNGVVFDTDQLPPSHKTYGLRAGDLASGKSLDDSVHYSGYRYIVTAAGEPYLGAEVHKHTSIPGQYIVHLNIGPFVTGMGHGLNHLASHPDIAAGSFEARFLRCIPLGFMAIWLKSDAGEFNDLIYPLPGGAPEPFVARQLYNVGDLTTNIQTLLQQRQPAP